VKEFTEVESGKNTSGPLAEAIEACRLYGAELVIAKIDRLSRDAHFLLGLEKAGVDFVAADMPNANRPTVGIMAMIAEEQRHMISARTKSALAAAKRRGARRDRRAHEAANAPRWAAIIVFETLGIVPAETVCRAARAGARANGDSVRWVWKSRR
jgi:DNA invertase Pin-like site-specific DNA recombinase